MVQGRVALCPARMSTSDDPDRSILNLTESRAEAICLVKDIRVELLIYEPVEIMLTSGTNHLWGAMTKRAVRILL